MEEGWKKPTSRARRAIFLLEYDATACKAISKGRSFLHMFILKMDRVNQMCVHVTKWRWNKTLLKQRAVDQHPWLWILQAWREMSSGITIKSLRRQLNVKLVRFQCTVTIYYNSFFLLLFRYVFVDKSVNSYFDNHIDVKKVYCHSFWISLHHAKKAKWIYSIVNSYFTVV